MEMNLLLLLILPLLTAIALLLTKQSSQVKWIALTGSALQLILAFVLLFAYNQERADGETSQMIFQQQYNWFPAWKISFHIGVDGISVAMAFL